LREVELLDGLDAGRTRDAHRVSLPFFDLSRQQRFEVSGVRLPFLKGLFGKSRRTRHGSRKNASVACWCSPQQLFWDQLVGET